jgi:hypothetical protein
MCKNTQTGLVCPENRLFEHNLGVTFVNYVRVCSEYAKYAKNRAEMIKNNKETALVQA